MRISPVKNNQISFKEAYMYRFAKNQFEKPDDLNHVIDDFHAMLPDLMETESMTKLQKFFNRIKIATLQKCPVFFLEQPFYIVMINELKKYGKNTLDLNWLSIHSGAIIEKPLDKDAHSFFVLTDEHKLEFAELAKRITSERPQLMAEDALKGLNPDTLHLRLLAQENAKYMNYVKSVLPDVFTNNCK